MKEVLDALGDRWMIRVSYDGTAYNGFRWQPVGEWTEAKDWDPIAVCGGGLHGQGPGGFGCSHDGTRFEFCETGEERVSIDGDKVKVRRARILFVGQQAYDALSYVCRGKFPGWLPVFGEISLPALAEIGGYVSVGRGATLTAPALTEVSGGVSVSRGATLTVPALAEIGDDVSVYPGATLTAPALTEIGGYVSVERGATLTAPALAEIGDDVLVSRGATLTVPALTEIGGYVSVYPGATLTAPASILNR